MEEDFTLFATITMAVILALAGGFIARKFRLPTLVGYLVAGLAISPFTPASPATPTPPPNWPTSASSS